MTEKLKNKILQIADTFESGWQAGKKAQRVETLNILRKHYKQADKLAEDAIDGKPHLHTIDMELLAGEYCCNVIESIAKALGYTEEEVTK